MRRLQVITLVVVLAVAGSACDSGDNVPTVGDQVDLNQIALNAQTQAAATTVAEPTVTQKALPTATETSTQKAAPPTIAPTKVAQVATAQPTPDTVNGLNRRMCPNNCTFTNEAAKGAFIRLTDGSECSGDSVTPCYVTGASGTVYGGVVNPFNQEINGQSWKATFASPATPAPEPTKKACPTIGCGDRVEIGAVTKITVNAAFRGAYIKLPDGRECIKQKTPDSLDCYTENANGAQVAGGVLYPFNEEYLPPAMREVFK